MEFLSSIIPREVVFGNPERDSAQISPDGSRLAYLAPKDGVLNVWIKSLGKDDARVVTHERKRGIREYVWQGDGGHILYGQDRNGDENWHLFQADLHSGQTRDLTPYEGVQTRNVVVHPNFPDEILVGLNLRDKRYHDVYRLDLKTGKLPLVAENPGDVEIFLADNTLQVRAALARLSDASAEIRVRDSERSTWRKLIRWGADEVDGKVLGFSPDNKRLWFTSSVESDTGRLLEADLGTAKIKVLAFDKHYDADKVLIHPTKRNLQAVQFIRERSEWEVLDRSIKPDFENLKNVRDGDFEVTSRDRSDHHWIVIYTLDDGPRYFYLYSRTNGKVEPLFSDRPALERYKLAQRQPICFQAADGMTLHGYLTLPVVTRQKNLPMVVLVHGGPYARDKWGYDPRVQWLANRGYAVLQVNYRGSTGYGKKYLQASFRERGGKMSTDLIDGKNWAVKQGYADPKRVGIYGVSYGGYATLVALSFTPDEFICGVEAFGASNLASLLKSFPPYWALFRLQWERRVGSLEQDEKFLKERSPLFKVDWIKSPLLIGHGANDVRVIQAESDQIVAAMRKNGKEVTYIVFSDEGHGFLRPENRKKWYAAAEQFLAKHLGGRAEPPSETENCIS